VKKLNGGKVKKHWVDPRLAEMMCGKACLSESRIIFTPRLRRRSQQWVIST